jgi:hypothetical protein
VVELAVLAFRRSPPFPAIRRIDDVRVALSLELRLQRTILLQRVEILQEKQPRGLLGVVELTRAQPASWCRMSSMFLKACSNMRRNRR